MNGIFFQKNPNRYLLSLLSGVLFLLAWQPNLSPFILFIVFIPLLFIDTNKVKIGPYFWVCLLSFLTAVTGTCYWVLINGHWWYILGIVWQALLMTVPFLLYYKIRNKFPEPFALFFLVAAWISYEYISLNFNYNFPWLLLGNAFANSPKYIQWYEYTGVLGGSIWVFAINVILYNFLKSPRKGKSVVCILALVAPIAISVTIYNTYAINKHRIEVVLVQPNFDPFTEKFPDGKNFIPYYKQIKTLITLASSVTNASTEYVLFPETAIIQSVWNNKVSDMLNNTDLEHFFKKYPHANLYTGIEIYESAKYNTSDLNIPTRYEGSIGYHELYNSSLLINPTKGFSFQPKCKLLPLSERLPWIHYRPINQLLTFLDIDKGLSEANNTTYLEIEQKIKIAPIICYESIFGNYVSGYVKKGANVIFILSNDGWWGESIGYKQHFSYARLRAIENRRSVARCANNGLSAFIDERGEIIASTKGFTQEAINNSISINSKKTIYTLLGDYLGVMFTIISSAIITFYLFFNKLSTITKPN